MSRIFRSVSACQHFRYNFLTQNHWNTINLRPTFATFSTSVNNAHDGFGLKKDDGGQPQVSATSNESEKVSQNSFFKINLQILLSKL